LAKTALPKRIRVSSLLLNCAGDARSNVTSAIDKILKEQTESQRSKPLSTYGEIKITLFCWQQGLLERKKALALDHARAAMLVAQDKERLLLELSFDTSERLIDVNYTFLRFDDIPTSELDKLKALAEELRLTRIQRGKQHGGKIGRNDYCPCGSGKKYKRCCLLLGAT
jgi:preprotein translocase subunit SecA